MLRQVCTTSLPLIVYNPTGVFNAEYFSSCANGGALPVFDTEMIADDDAIRYIDELGKYDFLFGVRISASRENLFKYLNDGIFPNCDAVVIYYDNINELKNFTAAGSPYSIIVEVTDIAINDILDRIDPNALILKGFEAPGKVSKYTSFILLQWYTEKSSYPFFIHGGVGYFTAAGMFAAGASGIVLDNQLFLTDEAPVSENVRAILSKLEESDTLSIIDDTDVRRRFFAKLGTKIVRELSKKEDSGFYKNNDSSLYEDIKSNYSPVSESSGDAMQKLFYLGQDAIFAKYFISDSKKTADIIRNLFRRISEELSLIEKHDPMVEDSALAIEHGTKYPITQGPMANISDNMEFAKHVHEGGALPFFAVGSLPADIAKDMIIEGKKVLPSFGAGMVGVLAFNKFLPEHMELVKAHKAPFALFAAGNPSQIKELETAGTKAYLHTPSMSMLNNAISSGCRRFIFEGTEAGGHIGNLSSMVLWELALETVNSLSETTIKELRLLFAGGVGTTHASHFVSGMASSTAAKGCGIGVQISTPYLFTKEIVESGALTELYQEIMCRESGTIVIGNTVGLNARTVGSPFSRRIHENEVSRLVENISLTERKELFEHDNTGSLLIGAKGFKLDFSDPANVKKIPVNNDDQYKEGNFMAGDIMSCDDCQITISDVHNRIINSKAELTRSLNSLEILFSDKGIISDEIAIIGMGCVYPDAANPEELWQNVLSKRYSISDMPDERLKPFYYDKDKKAEDKTYTKIAGTVRDYRFDNKKFGFSDEEAKGISRSQAMILEAAARAVEDAGYAGNGKKIPAEKTAVIIASCLTNEMNSDLNFKYFYPEILYYLDQIDEFKALGEKEKQSIKDDLRAGMAHGHINEVPEGASIHMESSRVASYLGVKGVNYTIDAACASSLAALDAGQKELLSGLHDMVVVGGLNTNLSPESFVGFCKMGALSAEGSFPFDERANGFVLGEGAGVVVIKRMKDAIRDGDRVYAVIKGIGSSSDGKGKAIAAPNPDGQEFALERCYNSMHSNIPMSDIDYIEAHGTSTLMGDLAEIETLKKVYGKHQVHIGLSSVKSQIGHLLGGAGLAGLIKAIQAIKHKTLPPNGQFEKLSPRFDLEESGLYIIKDPIAWETKNGKPRLAAVSSFGFGGVNFHCVVGEAGDSYQTVTRSKLFSSTRDVNDRRVVIAGMGITLPGIKNTDDYLNALESGKSLLTDLPVSRFHNEYFTNESDENYSLPKLQAGSLDDSSIDGKKYRMPPTIVRSIDRSQFIGLECTKQALEQSGLMNKIQKGNNTAVIVGTMSGEKMLENIIRTRIPLLSIMINGSTAADKATLSVIDEKLSAALKQKYHVNNEDTVPGLLSNIVSGRIANFFGLNGVNCTVDAGSASSAVAMRLALLGIRCGEYENVVTGGIESSLTPATFRSLKIAGMLSSGDCTVFDVNSAGVNLSEGGALYLLTSYKNAKEKDMPVLAEIESIGLRGRSQRNDSTESEPSFSDAVNTAYESSSITRRQVNFIDLYGSSVKEYDLAEYNAMNTVYKSGVLSGNSTPEIGYYRSASTAVVSAKLTLMNNKRRIPASVKFGSGNSIINNDSALKPVKSTIEMKEKSPHYFAANIFSKSGVYGHALIGTLPLSASAGKSIQRAVAANPPAAAYKPAPEGKFTSISGSMVTALLSGQGAQHAGMMKELYKKNGIIRDTFDRGDTIFKTVRGYSLLDIMFGDDPAINSTENTQPSIFLSTAAVYDALKPEGFNPAYFIGHSLGECSALYCAGILGFEESMKLILTRSTLMKEAAGKTAGEIMVVFGTWTDTASLIQKTGVKDVYVTNKNSESQTVVAGTKEGIASFTEHLKASNIVFKKLPLSGAFHTPLFASAAEGLKRYLSGVRFNNVDYSRVISNVTARPYPQDESQVKELLSKQVVSPVEFIESVKFANGNGGASFIEVGPAGILTNLLKSIKPAPVFSAATVDQKKGEAAAFENIRALINTGIQSNKEKFMNENKVIQPTVFQKKAEEVPSLNLVSTASADDGFKNFLSERKEDVERVLYEEYRKYSQIKEIEERSKFGFYTGDVVITGVAVGLPGKSRKVFEDDNIDCILKGENRIESIGNEFIKRQIDKNITRVNKKSDGSASLQVIKNDNEVVHLAGQLGYFNRLDYGIEFDNDKADAIAMAAGIEALRDAGIPLVPQMRRTSTGSYLFDGYGLPEEMQETTGVIRTSVFAGFDSIIEEVAKYTTYLNVNGPLKLFESIYYFIMEKASSEEVKRQVTDWYFNLKKQGADAEYVFNRNFILKMGYMGAPQFAQFIKAKGPNTQSNAACASVTQGIGMAEDWIRTGRCDRVVVIGSEVTDPERLGQWLHAGFLAMGAATIKNNVFEAAKPFDADRNGTIIGSGASAIVVERGDLVRKRGRAGQAEILGTVMGNSAFHGTRIDIGHIGEVFRKMVDRVEKRHGLNKDEYTKSMMFMSHETFTPAVGGSAQAEIDAIKGTYPQHYRNIIISNTKGFTGHTLGGGLEDPVMIKAMQLGITPPIANLNKVPAEFGDLRFSRGEKGAYNYGLHFAAGFGSHFALLFARRIEEKPMDNPVYLAWLKQISGYDNPELSLINKALCIKAQGNGVTKTAPAIADVSVKTPVTASAPVTKIAEPAPAATIQPQPSGKDLSSIVAEIKSVIASQTGYTVDMLDNNLDLEADLGIDTVKQVEIFGKISAQFSLEVPEDLKLSNMNTIDKLVQYIASKVQVASPASASAVSVPTHAVATATTSSGVDISAIITEIKSVIAAQTGYTVDMLEDGLDLEADLGIDTVKQVEIFGKISAKFSLEVPEDLKLSDMNTIDKLVQYIASKIQITAPAAIPGETLGINHASSSALDEKSNAIHRFTISVTGLPAVKKVSTGFAGKTFLISKDNYGYSEKITEGIIKNGGKVLTIGSSGSVDCKVDMNDPVEVEKAVTAFADVNDGINSFIHLSPIDYALGGTHTSPKAIESSVKSFFIIIRALNQKLRKKESIIASLSFNSVVFPYGNGRGEIYPIFAGVAGMLKTINKEFSDAVVKAVDFSTDTPKKGAETLSDIFLNELLSGDRRVEVGYRNGERFGLLLNDEAPAKSESLIKNGSTLLVTGGAGGITFEILKRFVRDFRDLKLVIFDITDIDSVKQEFLAESASEESIIASLKNTMQGAKPLEIKNAAGRIMRAKKALANMNELKKLGADVDYNSVDVNSADSVAKALKKHKKIDGVIHAAGMEESQIIEKMTFESFNRVFNVKAYGSLNLVSALSKIDYNFFVAFSSVAARFGNEGQVNYSGGNEMLAKVLFREMSSHKKRVYKICDWTAWEGAGMATNETVHKVLKERGMTFLPLEQGIELFMNELCDQTAVETVYTGIDASFDRDGILPGGTSGVSVAPFLDSIVKSGPDRMSFSRTLDINRDLFIMDHTKDGIPLFLGATGIETMAEAAAQLAGKGLFLRELRDFQIPYSIKILKGRPKEIFVEAEKDRSSAGTMKCRITSQFKNTKGIPVGDPTLHYEGSYIFSTDSKQPVITIPPKVKVEVDGDFQQIIYHPERLFMDGVFRTVQGIHSFDGELLVSSMKHAPEREFFSGVTSPDFLVDVVLIDAMFQTGGIFEMMTTSDIILPSKINRMIFHQTPEKGKEYLCFTRKIASGEEANTFSLTLADYDGKVYIEIDRFDMVKVTRVPKESRIDTRFRIAG